MNYPSVRKGSLSIAERLRASWPSARDCKRSGCLICHHCRFYVVSDMTDGLRNLIGFPFGLHLCECSQSILYDAAGGEPPSTLSTIGCQIFCRMRH